MNFRVNLEQELRAERAKFITRRWFFRQCGVGLGSIALGSLLTGPRSAQSAIRNPQSAISDPLAPKQPHFKPKAAYAAMITRLDLDPLSVRQTTDRHWTWQVG